MNFKNYYYNLFLPNEAILSEDVDWEQWSDVSKTCKTPEEVTKMLNDELDRLSSTKKNKNSFNINNPRFTRNTMENSKNDISKFISDITTIPETIFDKGMKSAHSTTEKYETVNTGIPAFRAILWDNDNKQFFVINTCPSAGSCPMSCYALDGFYIMHTGKNIKLVQRLQFLMDNPKQYERKAYRELEEYAWRANRDDKTLQIRWNDAGDFFADKYIQIAINLHNKLKENGYKVKTYAYTKRHNMVEIGKAAGFTMNFSTEAKIADRLQVNFNTTKISDIIPKEVYKQFVYSRGKGFAKDENDKTLLRPDSREAFKQRVREYYENLLPPFKKGKKEISLKLKDYQKNIKFLEGEQLIFTDELPEEESEEFKYNVIVLPFGDSDAPAQRADVHYTLLCEH